MLPTPCADRVAASLVVVLLHATRALRRILLGARLPTARRAAGNDMFVFGCAQAITAGQNDEMKAVMQDLMYRAQQLRVAQQQKQASTA